MKLEMVIGLEIHVQLRTKSKMFCRCDNNAEGKLPNSLVCPICFGMPGTLPMPNKQAIEWAIKTALALNCTINKEFRFDRKHYFYPDLPKGYQISQYDRPLSKDGWIEIDREKIGIKRIHLEEDAGKLVHPEGADYSLVDLNRAGTPLLEIVTEPDIHSPDAAKKLLQELRSIVRYLRVSDADMEKGHLRCDANISVSVDGKEGTPIEIKNLNSFRMVERALAFEEERQKTLIEAGDTIHKETRGWDDQKGETVVQRGKEYAQDYRYFPEPDIPPFSFDDAQIEKIKKSIPELPAQRREKFIKMGIPATSAALLAEEQVMGEYFEKVAKHTDSVLAANWLINENLGIDIPPDAFIEFIDLLKKGTLSSKLGKIVIAEMRRTGKTASTIIQEQGLTQVSDEAQLEKIVEQVVKENPKTVEDYKKGKAAALQFLVGQVMRQTKGQANPKMVQELLQKKLG